MGRHLSVRASTPSAHLAMLRAAGLATVARDGRFITYAADMPGLRGLMTSLLQDWRGGANR